MSGLMAGQVEFLDGMAFRATVDSGHEVVLDTGPDLWGSNRGARPMEMLLIALAACTGMSTISTLQRERPKIVAYKVRVRGESAEQHPKVFTRITLEHELHGRGLSADTIRRSVELAATRYCSVAAMLGQVVTLDESFRIRDVDTGTEATGHIDHALS